MTMNNIDTIESSDLALVSFLWTYGQRFIDMRREAARVFFIFPKNEISDDLIVGYWDRTIKVDPMEYFSAIKQVKSFIYQKN